MGKWVLHSIGDIEDGGDLFKCCTCKRIFGSSHRVEGLQNSEHNRQYAFCPWCGVKFDGCYENTRYKLVTETDGEYTWTYYKLVRPKYREAYIREHSQEIYLNSLRSKLEDIKRKYERYRRDMSLYKDEVEEYMFDDEPIYNKGDNVMALSLMEMDPRGLMRPRCHF